MKLIDEDDQQELVIDLLVTLNRDVDETVIEEQIDELRALVAAACHGFEMRAAICALSLTLQSLIVAISEDEAGIEAFGRLFTDALRKRWRVVQAIDPEAH